MTEREALTIFLTIQKCRHQALHTNDCGNCERCQYYLEQEQIDGAVALAISALEKQTVDKCCETCKYKNRSAREIPCCDCYMESCFEDCYEPYTEEES
jgi:hypothetical protein